MSTIQAEPWPGADSMGEPAQADPSPVEQMQRVLQRLQSKNLHDKYSVVKNIGVGENGTVQLVRERESGKFYAVRLPENPPCSLNC